MEIGRKIYYEKDTGNFIVDTGERSGDVVKTTWEQDFKTYKALAERVEKTVGVIELKYGAYKQDFMECSSYRVNIKTKDLEFSYPDPSSDLEHPQEPMYQRPLTDRIAAIESENLSLTLELTMTQARLEQAETGQATLLLSLVEGGVL
ncbi:hypothetical protein ACFRAM_24315 [Paenibacillus sp. NPDC056722]|uniref:hypothetical protein n=1 Tax=Paenibacillus sp. NPDC056722 TaxID=3345924 RepID=UPI003682C7BF